MTIENKLVLAKELFNKYSQGVKTYDDLKNMERSFDSVVSKDKPFQHKGNGIISVEVGQYGVIGHYFAACYYKTLLL
jgi:glutamate synthase domain-containing protein 3